MADRSLAGGSGSGGPRVGRRGFIGAGLAGAGALVVPVAAATARSKRATPRAGGPIGQKSLQATYPHLPAIPQDPAGVLDTLAKLQVRSQQVTQAKQGMTRRYRIGGTTGTAYAFLFGGKATVSLERPEQYAMSWTTYPDVYSSGAPHLEAWADSLTDADAATRQFWPMIAQHGTAFNLILPERVTAARARELRRRFQIPWTQTLRRANAAGNLYAIDMSRFEALQPQTVDGDVRFTPATVTLLTRDPRTKTLTPVAIVVAGYRGRGRRLFTRADATDGAWLYALQAAKTSIAVFGIWLGHVYHWHIVTAAMQMTMLNTLPASHPIYQLLAPQSKYLIPFDDALLALWSRIAPPTSVATADQFLSLANDYADRRSFFEDDPRTTLKNLGLRQSDFTRATAWDQYPLVAQLLAVWDLVATYVRACVRATYGSDAAVAGDRPLQAWIAASSAPTVGNVRGLPRMTSRSALERVLTSILYRVTVHGVARLTSSSNPALTFVANFPHCLQRAGIPDPRARLSTRTLLTYLPNTQTISAAVSFYFTFAFSTPYEPFIPLGGVDANLFFPHGRQARRNQALIDLRNGLAAFIDDYQPDAPQRFQWPLNIET